MKTDLAYLIFAMVITILGFSPFALSEPTPLQVVNVASVYDGDTFKVNLNCAPDIFCKNISIRPAGYDAIELRGATNKADAIAARDQLRDLLENAQRIELRNVQRGKYFRIVADVYIDNVSLSEIMLATGLVKRYDK